MSAPGFLTKMVASLRDVKILLAAVFLRRASFGITSQVLTLFLVSLGISKTSVGLFMTLTLLGDTLISLGLTWYSEQLGRRVVMITGCVLMVAAGLMFAQSLSFWVLLSAAVLGVISTSGDETGPFKSVEEACLSHLVPPELRAFTFATYGLLGTLGSAVGSLISGGLVLYWSTVLHWPLERCYRTSFVVYAFFGLLKLALSLTLSDECELDPRAHGCEAASLDDAKPPSISTEPHSQPLLEDGVYSDYRAKEEPLTANNFAPETYLYLPRLLVVFMLDSVGYSFMPPAWIVYYFKTVYDASPAFVGTLFFFTNLVDAISSVVSALTFLAFGPVKAILVAQLPSAAFFANIPLWDSHIAATAFYFFFCACATMDVVPRQILLTHLIPARDLTRALGLVNIAKTFARCIGPLFSGRFAELGRLDIAFYINSACLLAANTILGCSFMHLDQSILRAHGK